MKLLFFKPGYYSKCNNVEDLMTYLMEISLFVKDIEYSSIIKDASISKQINYNKFINSSWQEKQVLLMINLLSSIKSIEKKGKLDYKSFKNDMFEFCRLHNIDIEMFKKEMMNND